MDKAILKKFAIESRQDLMQKIENKIKLFYVDETFSKQQNGDVYVLSNEKHTLSLSKEEYEKRELLVKRINELGTEQVIEEAAYTWFNRIVAIRYMEINDYLPLTKDNQSLGIRVLSSKDNTPDPEIMKFSNLTNPDLDIDFKKEKYIELKDDNEKYKYVLLLICKKLGKVIPQVFDGITDYIDLLIPDNLLNDSGFINKIVNEVPTENYKQVEIIGWLYQYYNQEEKDKAMGKNSQYSKSEIPYVTQLFTPSWIVKYMVENTILQYWNENDEIIDIENFKYFDDKNVEANSRKRNKNIEQFKIIDPCSGSGHILVYIFEVLYKLYEKKGYYKPIIAEMILKNNIYGLDIDERASQLSVLSVLLKAREYDKQIFNKDICKELNIIEIKETNNIVVSDYNLLNDEAKYLLNIFKDAKEIGSLIKIDKLDFNNAINNLKDDIFGYYLKEKFEPLIKQANILSEKYNVIVTNPPYLNNSSMPNRLKDYVSKEYPNSKTDLCVCFMELNMLMEDGYFGMINQNSWMFLSSFEKFREHLLNNYEIISMIHLGSHAFEEIGGEVVQTTAFVFKKSSDSNKETSFYRLVEINDAVEKEKKYITKSCPNFLINQSNFLKIPGYSIAYWITDNTLEIFNNNKSIIEYGKPKQGLATGCNNDFLRMWFEIDINKALLNSKSVDESKNSDRKWFPYNKGGEFRKWFGNVEYVVNWENDGFEIKNYKDKNGKLKSRPQNLDYYFNDGITWSLLCSSNFGCRYSVTGNIFDVNGMTFFFDNKKYMKYGLGLLCSKISFHFLEIINPTLAFQSGNIAKIPFIIDEEKIDNINELVDENINISINEWNSFETSWNFMSNPLIQIIKENNISCNLERSWYLYSAKCNEQFEHLKKNEETLNEIFIDIYNLEDELNPNIDDKDITFRKPDKIRDIKNLISYAVGCMFGRYSLDKDGLVYAGGDFDENNYKTFKADTDNIIPITDEAYFSDDIVDRFKDFIEVVYGKETLNANLDFIAETLGKKGTETSEETIRRYFLNDFYSDHIKMYQKKPIYWLFDSGKKNGFKALIYMHRYNENTVPKVRLDYLHRVQNTYDKLLTDVNYRLTTELSVSDKKIAQNRQANLNAKLQEITAYDEKIAHIANQRISIDLDDGVTANYSKFANILAKIK